MAQQDITASADTHSKTDKPCIVVELRDLRGIGMWPRDYIEIDIEEARELIDELEDAIRDVEDKSKQ